MNLITDAWIPIRRKSGKVERIAPCEITEGEDVIIVLAAPRPDFNGALIQFLIGLLQTTFAPKNPREWRKWFQQPPGTEELQEAFEPMAYAFELDGDGPRFMQDLLLENEVKALPPKKQKERIRPVYELLIDAPTGKTLDDNTDHFVKRGEIKQLCPACAAMALFTLQTNASGGGQGYRTGLRGGGPMTTVVLGETLWLTCWLNTLEQQTFLSLCGNREKAQDSDRFPWLSKTRTSEDGKRTTPEDTHPDQIFWSMPRRIRLIMDRQAEQCVCDLCGMSGSIMVSHFMAKNLGVNYEGPWTHPLSPCFVNNDGMPSARHPQPGGIVYRHWLGLVQADEDNQGKRRPARVVEHFIENRRSDLRLWAFGYDMDNMKARCWYDSTMPLVLVDDKIRGFFEFHTAALVNSAQHVSRETRTQIKKVFFKSGTDMKGDLSFVESRFWQETEGDFFECLSKLRDALNRDDEVVSILGGWHKRLARMAETIFDDVSQTGAFDAANPKRIALAWRDLQKRIYGKKLREMLGIPAKK